MTAKRESISADAVAQQTKSVFAAIYTRTSSRSNFSIKEQINQCWKFCRDRGWTVGYVFVDECQSGGSVERPKFQLMLEKAKTGEFQVIVFWKLDRFCRSLVDLVNVERSLRHWGIGLCSTSEFIDTTSSVGRFNYRNLASVAELEREIIGERARLGLSALAREHRWPNAHQPVGYDKREDGKLVINEGETKLVKRIFKMYIREKSMPQVAFELNREEITTKKGGKWNARAVRGVLTNKVYVGEYKVAGVEDYIKEYKIVGEGLFKRANEIRLRYLNGRAKRPPMPEDRKASKIEKMFNKYREFLQGLKHQKSLENKDNEEQMDGQ